MKFYIRVAIFLIINFGALGIGSILMDNGPQSSWYTNLNQAPWTPPGWVFGFAWTTIMFCFSIYMAKLLEVKNTTSVLALFAVQFVLNVSWNYVFFNQHMIALGLINIVLLTIIVGFMMFIYKSQLKKYTLLILPYFLWLLVASSLNGYILFNN